MPIPAAWDDRVLERTYEDDRGNPMTGTVTFTPTVGYVEDAEEDTAWFSRPVQVTLDSNGKATATVRTSDPDMVQHGYTHKVEEHLEYPVIAGQPTPAPVNNTYYIEVLPGPDPLLYGLLAPVQPGQGVVVVPGVEGPQGEPGPPGDDGAVGPAGPAGDDAYEVAVAEGFPGTRAEWLLSLKGDPGDTSGLATIATTGLLTDAADYSEPMLVGERQTEGILANRVMTQVRYSGGAYETITNASRLCRVFTGPSTADPAAAANEDDIWLVLP